MRMPPGTGVVPGTARPGSRAGEMGGGTCCSLNLILKLK